MPPAVLPHQHVKRLQRLLSLVQELKSHPCQPREVGWWALQWGASAEVLAPESLRQEMATTARQLAHVYEPTGQ